MKRTKKSVFFIVVLLIAALTYLTFFGFSTRFGDITTKHIKSAADIRWGIDIRGGVDVTFSPPDEVNATDEEMAAAESIIKVRLVSQNITDYEVYTDYSKDRIIVRFPWKSDEVNFNPEEAIKELGETALLTFREGIELDDAGKPSGVTADTVILEGKDIVAATAVLNNETNKPVVSLELTSEGAAKFAEATARLKNKIISIWMDDNLISYPTVNEAITEGKAMISGEFSVQQAKDLADKINAGALPFKLQTENFSAVSPTLGLGAKDAMVLAGAIAFALVAVAMVLVYRLPGAIAVVALTGQVCGMVASVTGFFAFIPSFTLTLPGIAGIVLSIGMGVDANIITNERIKEELKAGKTVVGSVEAGFDRAFSAIFDGNVTVVIIAIILMGAFGPPSNLFVKMFSPIFSWFGPTTAGEIFSFGFTLLSGVIFNQIMGVYASRLMLTSVTSFKSMRKPWLFGGAKNG